MPDEETKMLARGQATGSQKSSRTASQDGGAQDAGQYTPGPWQVSPLDGRTCGPSRALVCSGTTIRQMQAVAIVTLRTGETDANARLIAAAPDLLAALKDILAVIEADSLVPESVSYMRQARAAIAKADGR